MVDEKLLSDVLSLANDATLQILANAKDELDNANESPDDVELTRHALTSLAYANQFATTTAALVAARFDARAFVQIARHSLAFDYPSELLDLAAERDDETPESVVQFLESL